MHKTLKREYGSSKTSSIIACIIIVILILYVITLVYPLLWGLLNSFRSRTAYMQNIFGFPNSLYLGNYQISFQYFEVPIQLASGGTRRVGIGEMFVNSILYAGGSAFFASLTSCITAYLVAKFNYKFSKVVYAIVIITMILPIVGSLPSEIHMSKMLGIYDSIIGIWIMKSNFLGLYFLVFHAAFKQLPKDFAEAAQIDGASNLRILVSIYLPLVKNTFYTILLLQFIGFWNDYQTPMIYLESYPTVAYGLWYTLFNSTPAMSYVGAKLASSMIVFIPILLVFLSFNKRLMGNLTMGGIKG
jgi:ABC-type glycerol-3-phosphate transport system permease component